VDKETVRSLFELGREDPECDMLLVERKRLDQRTGVKLEGGKGIGQSGFIFAIG
jgi:hypothetical protein